MSWTTLGKFAVVGRVVTLLVLSVLLLACAAPVQAAEEPTQTPIVLADSGGVPAESAAPCPWTSEISLFAWFTGVDSVVTKGRFEIPVNEGFSDILDNVDVGIMAHYETRRDQTGFYADLIHARVTDQILVMSIINVDYEATQTYLEAGALFRPGGPQSPWDLIAGVRLSDLDASYKPTPGVPGSIHERWLDPLVGARYQTQLSDQWRFSIRGDIGAWHGSSARQVIALFRRPIGPRLALDLGYRYFDIDRESDDFAYSVTLSGPLVGVAYGW